MQIWDTAGQEKFQSVQGVFYKGSDACMIVFDITSITSFQDINKWKEEFLMHVSSESPDVFPFVLIGNKADMVGERKVSETKARQWCRENGGVPYYETSAKTAAKVKEAFEELAKKALESRSAKLYPLWEYKPRIGTWADKSVGKISRRTQRSSSDRRRPGLPPAAAASANSGSPI